MSQEDRNRVVKRDVGGVQNVTPFVAVPKWDFKTAILAGLRSDKYAPKRVHTKIRQGALICALYLCREV